MSGNEILLESGTNEVEIAEFILGGQSFGVNVAKIREFIPYKGLELTHLPDAHPSVPGVFSLRGQAVPLIELERHLGLAPQGENLTQVVVVTEFNAMISAYVADQIDQIHRISWRDFKPLDQIAVEGSEAVQVTGVIEVDGRHILILDLEHIIGEIFPHSIINYDEDEFEDSSGDGGRVGINVFFAEDSAIIRNRVSAILKSVGFEKLQVFENGQLCLDAIQRVVDQVKSGQAQLSDLLNIVVTDIEMPQMDGLSLCRFIKQEFKLDIPVLMFSSLINEQMMEKCRQVGASEMVSKPDTERLIELMDQYSAAK